MKKSADRLLDRANTRKAGVLERNIHSGWNNISTGSGHPSVVDRSATRQNGSTTKRRRRLPKPLRYLSPRCLTTNLSNREAVYSCTPTRVLLLLVLKTSGCRRSLTKAKGIPIATPRFLPLPPRPRGNRSVRPMSDHGDWVKPLVRVRQEGFERQDTP